MALTRSPEHAPGGRGETALARELAGDSAAVRRDNAEAFSCWAEALEILTDLGKAADAARVASKLASAEEASGLTEQACIHYAQAADFYKLAGDAHRVPMRLNNLAMLRRAGGELEEAAVLLRRALDEASKCHGRAHAETALIAANLGAVLFECGDLLGAEQHHMQAMGIREGLFGPTHPEVGLSLGHIAVIHQARGDLKRAQSFYAAALQILDQFPRLHQNERAVLRENLEGL